MQGLASNVLGSDASSDLVKDKPQNRPNRPIEATKYKSQWGPQLRNDSQPGAGSREERRALVRERKRQDLLIGAGNLTADAARYKRRNSDDFESTSAPPGEHDDRDALVYLHHVQKSDTLAGLSIRFNCQLATLKKANRLWSNDAIQTRTALLVPVDTCGVKGRPVGGPQAGVNNVGGDGAHDSDVTPKPAQGDSANVGRSDSTSTIRPNAKPESGTAFSGLTATSNNASPTFSSKFTQNEEPPWKHDSWVQLDGHPSPIEIVRTPRNNMGFFPRARRKSMSYSDLDSPSLSFDIPRPSIAVSDTSSSLPRNLPHRKRGSSGSQKQWAQQMSGPGGVGKLGGKGPTAPGPSTGLDQVLGKHLPSIAPPSNTLLEDEFEDHSLNSGKGLENVGVAIEGWVKKIAKQAAKAVEQPQQRQKPIATTQTRRELGISTTSGGGDLIELSNAFEIGEDEVDEEDRYEEALQRGRARIGKHEVLREESECDKGGGSKRKGD